MKEKIIIRKCSEELTKVLKTPALSCVEYYVIPWLKQFFVVGELYEETIRRFADVEQIIDVSSYENPIGIKRVQTIAEERGWITHEFQDYRDVTLNNSMLCLLQVTPEFFNSTQIPWRADHYVRLVDQTPSCYFVINEYPAEARKIEKNEATTYFKDKALIFSLRKGKEKFEARPYIVGRERCNEDCALKKLRDALLLYKVLLRRLSDILNSRGIQSDELIKYQDRINSIFMGVALTLHKTQDNDIFVEEVQKSIRLKEEQIFKILEEKYQWTLKNG